MGRMAAPGWSAKPGANRALWSFWQSESLQPFHPPHPPQSLQYPSPMALFSDAQRAQIGERLAALPRDVRLVLYGQSLDCDTCEETRRLLAELAGIDARLSLEERNLVLDREAAAAHGIDRAPGLVVESVSAPAAGEAEAPAVVDFGVRLLGAPLGYEFTSLLDAILAVSHRDSALTPASRERLATLTSPVHIQVFSTPT